MQISGIYQIKSHIKPERFYIGSSIDIKKRWWTHLKHLAIQKHGSIKLQRHYNKYGKDDLEFSILLCCDKNDLISQEQFFIDIHNPYFNICKIAGSAMGREVSEETKQKLREINLGKPSPNKGNHYSLEIRQKLSIAKKGKELSEEHKAKIRQSCKGINIGKKRSKETCDKISNAKKGKPSPKKGKKTGKPAWNKGVPMREESKLKMILTLKIKSVA